MRARTATYLLALTMLSILLIILRWQAAPPGSFHVEPGDPQASVSHFYDIEKSGNIGFRWSKSLSALSLPVLASRQVITITANPARPAGEPPANFRLLVGTTVIGEFRALEGWHTYSATLSSGISPDVRLLLESSTFYPAQSDGRRLGMAISEISASPLESRFGLTLPSLLWLILAATAPIVGYFAGRQYSVRIAVVWSILASILLSVMSRLVSQDLALPLAAGTITIAVVILLFAYSWRWFGADGWLAGNLTRLGRSRWELPALATGICLLSVAQTWPLITRFGDSLPGWPADNFAFLYKFWWFRTAMLNTHQWPFFDPNTFSPFGFNLGQGEPTLTNTIPGVLLGSLLNDVAAYNLMALSSFVISGIGAYMLVKEVSGSRQAALLGGLAFAFCPYRMAQFGGHIQLLGTGWIALTFYFTERALRTGRWAQGALAGLSLALAALSAWYYAYMVGLLLALYVVIRLWKLRERMPLKSLVYSAVAGVVVFGLVAGPVALPSLSLWGQGRLSHSAKAADEHSAAPIDYLIPNELQPLWGEASMRAHADENIIESSLYLGLLPALIAVFGWWYGRRKRRSNAASRSRFTIWAIMFVVSLVLSLGLTLHDTGGQVQIQLAGGMAAVPLPGKLLYDWLPLFSSMRAYARFGLIALLAITVLMGLGWRSVCAAFPKRASWLTLVASVLLLTDFWTSPYSWGTSRVAPTQAATFLASQTSQGAIMQMPLASALTGPALFAETYYGKPIAYGYDTFEPAEWSAARPSLLKFPEADSLATLRKWGVRYIVVSANAYGSDWPGTLLYLKSLPQLKHLSDFQEQRVWDVDPAVVDARPDMEEYLTPDSLSVFELSP